MGNKTTNQILTWAGRIRYHYMHRRGAIPAAAALMLSLILKKWYFSHPIKLIYSKIHINTFVFIFDSVTIQSIFNKFIQTKSYVSCRSERVYFVLAGETINISQK